MFSHTRARNDDESWSEHESVMDRVCEHEASGHDDTVEKSGMEEDVEHPTDTSVRKRIRSIIHDSNSDDGNPHCPISDRLLPVAHSALETMEDCCLGSPPFPTLTAFMLDTEPIHWSSPEININPEGVDVGCNINPAPVPQAVLPEGKDNDNQRTHTCGQKHPQLDWGCHSCREELSLVEREGGDAIECKGEGCKTLWVHESFWDYQIVLLIKLFTLVSHEIVSISHASKSWMCPTCMDMGVKHCCT